MTVFKEIYDVTKDYVEHIKIIEKNQNLEVVNSEYQKMLFNLIEENKNLRRDNFELKQRYTPMTIDEFSDLNIPLDKNLVKALNILEIDVRAVLRKELEQQLTKVVKNSLKNNKK